MGDRKMKTFEIISFSAKPTKCPGYGNEYFSWDHEDEYGAKYWSCNKCNYIDSL
jgi:ribosomal protein S27AE